jgi:7-cyano-7-deazaguanine synthase
LLSTQCYHVRGLFVDYGQAAAQQERQAVKKLQDFLGIEVCLVEAKSVNRFGPGELIGRNAFLISTAIFLGQAHRGLVAIGVHSGTPYYDCSPSFIAQTKQLAQEHTGGGLTVVAPFLDWNKGQIVAYFRESGLPLLATYSCESGTIPPCGSCASCRDRRAIGC